MLAKPTVIVLVALTGVVGMPAIAWIVAIQTQIQQTTTDEYRGRVFGASGTTASLLMLISSALAGGSADIVGASMLVFVAAIISILSGLMAWILFAKSQQQSEPVATVV